jgi:hypothetical protein
VGSVQCSQDRAYCRWRGGQTRRLDCELGLDEREAEVELETERVKTACESSPDTVRIGTMGSCLCDISGGDLEEREVLGWDRCVRGVKVRKQDEEQKT